MSLGTDHTLGLTENGNVYSWGGNWRGQLGRLTKLKHSGEDLIFRTEDVNTICTQLEKVPVSVLNTPGTKNHCSLHVAAESGKLLVLKFLLSRSSISVKRIYADMKELRTDPSDQYSAQPREDDLFDWHFTLRGPIGTSFEGGLYHGRILLPTDYPFKPPNIIFLTQNGRFELRKKICLSISAYHPETWQRQS